MELNLSIFSVGQASALLQVMPGKIQAAARSLAITPCLKINGIDHYSESDLQRISDHLKTTGNSRGSFPIVD